MLKTELMGQKTKTEVTQTPSKTENNISQIKVTVEAEEDTLCQDLPHIDWTIQLYREPKKEDFLIPAAKSRRRSRERSRSRSRSRSRKREKKSHDYDLDCVIDAMYNFKTCEVRCWSQNTEVCFFARLSNHES